MNCKIVCFDLETSGRRKSADVLQIAAKIDEHIFSVYIEPTQPVEKEANEANGLENICGMLYLQGKKLRTITMYDALLAFYEFLTTFSNGCLLTAHNALFDIYYLIREIKKYSLVNEFKGIIYGFCDTLKLLKKKFPDRKGKGMLKLSKLAEDFLTNDVSSASFHEALYDVIILEKLINALLTTDDLFNSATLYAAVIKKSIRDHEVSLRMRSYLVMKDSLTNYMIKKLAISEITYEELLQTYQNTGEKSVVSLLTEIRNKKPRVTNNKIILNKIIDHFEKVFSN